MAVENLAIISSSLSGLALNGGSALGSVDAWMTSHGMQPSHVALGAIAGAFLINRGGFDGALKGAAVVAVVEALYYHLRAR
jgi:hypothetical protein